MPLAGPGGDGHIGLHAAGTGPVTVGFGTAAARVAVIATKATATPRRATVETPDTVRPVQRARVRHAFTIIAPPTREFVVRESLNEDARRIVNAFSPVQCASPRIPWRASCACETKRGAFAVGSPRVPVRGVGRARRPAPGGRTP